MPRDLEEALVDILDRDEFDVSRLEERVYRGIDFGRGEIVPYDELLEEMIELMREDAEFFDCVAEIEHAREILAHGTSAHRQVAVWQAALDAGKDEAEALRDVVDMLIEDTAHGL